jgi:hypothetical protein
MEFIELMNKTVQDYYSAIKTLEEFGPDSSKNSLTAGNNELNGDEARVVGDTTASEGLDEENENSQDRHGSQKPGEYIYRHIRYND